MTQTEKSNEIAHIALREVGKPYAAHRDCSGFTAWCYRQVGITIPEGSVAQWGEGREVKAGEDWEWGDLLFWDTFGPAPGHVAIYVGSGYVVHALNEQKGIVSSRWDANMGGPFLGARRIFLSSKSPIVEEPAPVEESPGPKDQGPSREMRADKPTIKRLDQLLRRQRRKQHREDR